MLVKTRFAPSPTGYLHIGGARTALFAWLYAKKSQGKFVLRIEDTDRERSTQASVDAILEGMAWLKLDYDEGPIYQTDRFDRYAEIAAKLLADGQAYPCYCSKERLENLRNQQIEQKQKPRYDQHCRHLAAPVDNQASVIRFKNPQTGSVTFEDAVFGSLTVQNSELDDLVLVRADGTPTYNFTVVIDDWDMEITHVIRGDDHINNTFRQINILKALGAKLPAYAHVPMILGSDGQRLSKRHGAVSVLQYRDEGYLPEALLNYLVRLGWSHGDQEIFSREEMIHLFDTKAINKSPGAFNPEKLLWLNQHYLKTLPVADLAERLKFYFEQANLDYQNGPALVDLVAVQRDRVKTLSELVNVSTYFYQEPANYNEDAVAAHWPIAILPALTATTEALSSLENWSQEDINQVLKQIITDYQLKMPQIAQAIRIAITGNTTSPAIGITLELLGKEQTLFRLCKALAVLGGYLE